MKKFLYFMLFTAMYSFNLHSQQVNNDIYVLNEDTENIYNQNINAGYNAKLTGDCEVPKVITPNNDGYNDFFDLSCFYPEKQIDILLIYNRWGEKVYSKEGYVNEFIGKTNNGVELPAGTYYYIIKFLKGKKRTGWVYIIR